MAQNVINYVGSKKSTDTPPLFMRMSRKPAVRSAGGLRQACAEHIAKKEGLKIEPIDSNEPPLIAYRKNYVRIVGQMTGYAFLTDDNRPKMFNALVVSGGDKILISWQLLMCWGIIHPTLPNVLNPNKLYKIRQGVSIEDATLKESEAILETNKDKDKEEVEFQAEKGCFRILMTYLMTKFSPVFKTDLEESDTIRTKEPIKIKVNEDADITPSNITHLRKIGSY